MAVSLPMRWWCALVLAVGAGSAVTYAADSGVESVRFLRYGVEDGLSQTTVRTLLQDQDGFIWLGTQDGLDRFDGYEFRVYRNDPMRPGTLGDNHITALEPSASSGFWIGTMSGGLARYDPVHDQFVRIQANGKAGGLAGNTITALKLDSLQRLWVATSTGSLQWLDDRGQAFHGFYAISARRVGVVNAIEPYRGGLLLATRRGLFQFALEGTRLRPWEIPAPGAGEVTSIARSPDGREIWVGTSENGLLRYSEEGRLLAHWLRADGLADDNIRALKFDRLGRLWVAAFDGLSRFDTAEAQPKTWRYNQGLGGTLASSRIQSLMEDRDGLMWIGTWLNGVSLFIPRTEAFREINLPGLAVPGLYVDRDDSLWFGVLEGGGLIHFDLQKGILARYVHDSTDPRSLPSNLVQNIVRDRKGRLWVATGAGLAKLDENGKGFEIFRNRPDDPGSLPYNGLQRLLVDSRGTLWVGTAGGGMASLCETCSSFKNYPPNDQLNGQRGLGGDTINALFEDSVGDFWIGLRPGGLVRLDRDTGRMEHFHGDPTKPGFLSHNNVSVLFEDSRRRLWVGTQGGGLNLMIRGADESIRFKALTTRDGLASNAIGGIAEDERGNLWISTTAGISRYNPERGQIENFGTRDGAQGLGYFIGSYGHLGNGQMLFGGLRGVTTFDPYSVISQPSPHQVVLTGLRILRKASAQAPGPHYHSFVDREGRQEIDLEPLADDLSFEFSAMSFTDPLSLRYAYRLDGVDEDWVETDARRRIASYNNLEPGKYQFRVRASSPDGQWGDELVLPVHLAAPFWLTPWAKAGYVLIVLVILLTIVWNVWQRLRERARSRQVLVASEERLKLALWGTGDELWDLDLQHNRLRRTNPLKHLLASSGETLIDDATQLRKAVHPDDLIDFDHAMTAHIKGETDSIEAVYRVQDLDGEWRWLHTRGRVVDRDAVGHAQRLVGTSSDITDLKANEQELAKINLELEQRVHNRTEALNQLNQDLRQTIDELTRTQHQLVESEKLAALGGLVAGVAHEINTPLGIGVTASSHLEQEARRMARMIQDGRLSKEELENFSRVASESSLLILRNLNRADKLIKSFKQVAVDQSSEQRRSINLRTYLDEILTSLHPSIRKAKHEISVTCPDDIEFETFPGAIYQIGANLIMNSLMHGFSDAKHGHIEIIGGRQGNEIVIEYRDDGKGMTEDVRRRVFEPFFTTRRGQGGSGLGMHIAWNLASQMLGGSLVCESSPGKGVRFLLRIPERVAKPR